MAWRIADSVEHGEIDNRTRDRVTGKIWLRGMDEPVVLELTGNPWRDLAGQVLRFVNPKPKPLPEHYQGFAPEQTGVVGDITAARKVKILEIPDDQFEHYYKNKIPMPYHWGNSLYLEWHSARNGRVVIEATDYELSVSPEATTWQMTEAEEKAQHEANARAMVNFMDTMLEAAAEEAEQAEEDEDAPQSKAEAQADAEAARMDLLNDRIQARLDREPDFSEDTLERIMEEERTRLRRERGEPDPEPLTPVEEAERAQLIEEMNAAAEEALSGDPEPMEDRTHPLVDYCHDLANRVRHDIDQHGWLPESAPQEHPLHELEYGICFASAKLAGALNGRADEWPPDPLCAGDCLVRLKKARSYLKDAHAGLEAAEAEKLTEPSWIPPLHQELQALQQSVQDKIDEVRAALKRKEG